MSRRNEDEHGEEGPHQAKKKKKKKKKKKGLGPDFKGAVGRGGDDKGISGIEGDGLDGVFMAPAAPCFVAVEVIGGVAAEEAVVGGDNDPGRGAVESNFVAGMVGDGDGPEFRHCADVPKLDDAVGVAGCKDVAFHVDGDGVASIRVAVEGLNTKGGPGVPDGHGFIAGRRT